MISQLRFLCENQCWGSGSGWIRIILSDPDQEKIRGCGSVPIRIRILPLVIELITLMCLQYFVLVISSITKGRIWLRIRIFFPVSDPTFQNDADPDLHQNVADPQHWVKMPLKLSLYFILTK